MNIKRLSAILFFFVACVVTMHAQRNVAIADSLEKARAVDYYYIQSRNFLEQGDKATVRGEYYFLNQDGSTTKDKSDNKEDDDNE